MRIVAIFLTVLSLAFGGWMLGSIQKIEYERGYSDGLEYATNELDSLSTAYRDKIKKTDSLANICIEFIEKNKITQNEKRQKNIRSNSKQKLYEGTPEARNPHQL